MPAKLVQHSYGKSRVRLTKVARRGKKHELIELDVSIQLRGNFAETYTTGDNRRIVATDSMKNTVYVLARERDIESIEQFAEVVATHFLMHYAQVSAVTVEIKQAVWKRIKVGYKPHAHAFVSGGDELRGCECMAARRGKRVVWQTRSSIRRLVLLKTTGSAFRDFVRNRYTTLKDTDDRIFATEVNASWCYENAPGDLNRAFHSVRNALMECFATHMSLSVQQTLLVMGEGALNACREITEISLKLPNQHRLLVNLEPFGLSNDNVIFVPTDEPFGDIRGVIKRK